MLGEDGGKMSKSKRNYREPNDIFDRYGADALRWYFFANQPPWTSIRYSEQAIKDCIPEFLLRLWNVYSFFIIYAKIDGFDPAAALCGAGVSPAQLGPDVLSQAKGYRPVPDRGELDRWILSELNRTAAAIVERMDAYDNFAACARLTEFVDALSNWYVRRSRDRFWSSGKVEDSADKSDAYWTLYECLLTTCKLIAPFVPFLAEAMWQNLAVAAFDGASGATAGLSSSAGFASEEVGNAARCTAGQASSGTPPNHRLAAPRREAAGTAAKAANAIPWSPVESVHLCDYPAGDPAAIDAELSEQMALAREVVSQGRSARMAAKLKVRQPLALAKIALIDALQQDWLQAHAALICEELNVHDVEFTQWDEVDVNFRLDPNWKKLGPRLGRQMPAVKMALAALSSSQVNDICSRLERGQKVPIPLTGGSVELNADDVFIRLEPKPGLAAVAGPNCVVVLVTELTGDLIREGVARDFVRALQETRKEFGFQFTDRIMVMYDTPSGEIVDAANQFLEYIKAETLSVQLGFEPHQVPIDQGYPSGGKCRDVEIAGKQVKFWIRRMTP
jgi:isoleucyl-tRNA synthetase